MRYHGAIDVQTDSVWRNSISTGRQFTSRFVGSFFSMDQLPRDGRPEIAVAGRSNVGKSSLLNRLLGSRKLAKVSSTPGKTRSLNYFLANDRFYFVDLPGYGYARVPLAVKEQWGKLMEAYLTGSENLVGLLLLLDSRRDPTPEDFQLIDWLAERELPVLVALTKADKLTRDKINRKVKQTENGLGTSVIPCSATTGQGKTDLVQAIRELIERHTKL
jgi:GTP-binding protein